MRIKFYTVLLFLLSQLVANGQTSTIAEFDFSLIYNDLTITPKPGTKGPTNKRPISLNDYTCSSGDASLSFSVGSNADSKDPYWANPDNLGELEVETVEGNTMMVSVPQQYKITRVRFEQHTSLPDWAGWSIDQSGTWKNKAWTPDGPDEINHVTFTSIGANSYKLVTVTYSLSTMSDIENLKTDDADEYIWEYYTLQGLKLADKPICSGYYIVRTNKGVRKIFID